MSDKTQVFSAKMLARSKAGHDKGKVYVVIREDETYYYLVNGTTRPLSKPKRKKRMHLQVIYHLPAPLLDQMSRIGYDHEIKAILKDYTSMEVIHVKD